MEQLIIHLISDYWLQNDWMATNKKKHFWIALVHSIVYTIPFILLTRNILSLSVICITHALIDGTNIVNRLNQIKNWDFNETNVIDNSILNPNAKDFDGIFFMVQKMHLKDGYGQRPLFLRMWLIIIQDNILHLAINYLALKYL